MLHIGKWQQVLESGEDILEKVTSLSYIQIFSNAELIVQFKVDLYFKLVEKILVDEGRLIVSLLDGSEVEYEI
jgi:hypothetical protein